MSFSQREYRGFNPLVQAAVDTAAEVSAEHLCNMDGRRVDSWGGESLRSGGRAAASILLEAIEMEDVPGIDWVKIVANMHEIAEREKEVELTRAA